MRLRRAWTAAIAGSVITLAACSNPLETDGDTITLRVGTGLSEQHSWWADGIAPWMQRVTELTDGQVQFESFTGGELVEVPDEVEAVENGVIDIGLLLPIYDPGQFPLAEVTMLPVTHSDARIAAEAWESILDSDQALGGGDTYYEHEYGSRGLQVFPLATTQEYAISTTGTRFESAADVRGTSIRTPSRIHETYAGSVGFNSVTIPAVEMYDAMSRGAFDGSFYSIADWSGYGFQDLFEYTVVDINFGHFNGLIGMTDETWDSLPENVQEAMAQAHDDIYLPGADAWIERGADMVEVNTGQGGEFVSFGDLSTEVQDLFLDGIEETWLDYIALLDSQDLPGEDIAVLWRDALVAAGGEVPDSIAALG